MLNNCGLYPGHYNIMLMRCNILLQYYKDRQFFCFRWLIRLWAHSKNSVSRLAIQISVQFFHSYLGYLVLVSCMTSQHTWRKGIIKFKAQPDIWAEFMQCIYGSLTLFFWVHCLRVSQSYSEDVSQPVPPSGISICKLTGIGESICTIFK